MTYSTPQLTWTGTLPANGTGTVTYSFTVKPAGSGDGKLINKIVGPSGSYCQAGTTDSRCGGGRALARRRPSRAPAWTGRSWATSAVTSIGKR